MRLIPHPRRRPRQHTPQLSAADDTDGLTVMRKMKAMPVDDFFAPGAKMRADGRLMNDMLLAEVKTPAEVKSEWDLLKIKGVAKASDIMRSIADGGCTRLDPPEPK